jgi:hypothetical protein
VASTVYRYPANSAVGIAIMLAGLPVYFFWSRRGRPDFQPGSRQTQG